VFLGVIVGLAFGFGVGWAVFEHPWESAGAPSSTDVENELLRVERAHGRDADRASCSARQATGGREYDCAVFTSVQRAGGILTPTTNIRGIRATVNGDRISFRNR
jgi:hypothetical protein